MRSVSPCLALAAGLVLAAAAAPAAAAGPGAHGFATPAAQPAVFGHPPGFHRPRPHWRHHHRGLRHLPRFGGFWPGYPDPRYAGPAVVVQQNVAPAYPAVPEVIGIRSAPAAEPVVYVIKSRRRGARPLVREGRLVPSAAGPRIVELWAPPGL